MVEIVLDKNLTTNKKGEQKDVDQETADLSLSSKLDKKLQEAIELHQKNQLIRAKKVCGQILSVNSQHTSTIHLLGLIAFQENQPQKAAKLIQHAIKLAKDSKKNNSLREKSKKAANKYLFKSHKTLKEFEHFLIKVHRKAK